MLDYCGERLASPFANYSPAYSFGIHLIPGWVSAADGL